MHKLRNQCWESRQSCCLLRRSWSAAIMWLNCFVVDACIIQPFKLPAVGSEDHAETRYPTAAGQPRQCRANRSGRGLRIRIAEIHYSAIFLSRSKRHRERTPTQERKTCRITEACSPALQGSFPRICEQNS